MAAEPVEGVTRAGERTGPRYEPAGDLPAAITAAAAPGIVPRHAHPRGSSGYDAKMKRLLALVTRMFSRAMVGDAQGTLHLVGSLSGTAKLQIGERWSTLVAKDDGDQERIPSDAFVLSIPAADLPKPQ